MAEAPSQPQRSEYGFNMNDAEALREIWENPILTAPVPAQAPESKLTSATEAQPQGEQPAESDGLESIEEFPEDFPDYYDSTLVNYLAASEATQILQKREDTRGRLAIIYTIATFLMFVLGFVVATLDAVMRQVPIVEGLSTILPLISGIFLGTLGFVLGYYFRQADEQDSSNGTSAGN
jgi:hypothetical protein